MANPYHDENGMFCSKGEMGAAIERLATKSGAEAFDNYFKLRTEYENIESNKLTISQDFMKTMNNNGLYVFRDKNVTEEDMRSVYSMIDLNNPETFRNESIINMLESPNLPEDIKADILMNAPLNLKAQILQRGASSNDPMLGSDLLTLLKNETSDELIGNIIYTNKLTFEDKYNLAKQSRNGLTRLAAAYSTEFFAVPALENELRIKTEDLADNNLADFESFQSLASHGKMQASHDLVIDKSHSDDSAMFTYDAKENLAGNKNISPETGLRLAQVMLNKNIADFDDIESRMSRNTHGNAGSLFFRASRSAEREPFYPYPSAPSKNLTEEYEKIKIIKAGLTDNDLARTSNLSDNFDKTDVTYDEVMRIATVEAHWNSHKENYVNLLHRSKIMSKRNAPHMNEFKETQEMLDLKIKNANKAIRGKNFVIKLDQLIKNNNEH